MQRKLTLNSETVSVYELKHRLHFDQTMWRYPDCRRIAWYYHEPISIPDAIQKALIWRCQYNKFYHILSQLTWSLSAALP